MLEERVDKIQIVSSQTNKPARVVTISPRSNNHKHTIIWIHGLNQFPEKYLHLFNDPIFDDFKIIAPQAPTRYVTLKDAKMASWFDIKYRSQTSFTVPFDHAFSTAEVLDSYQVYIKPLIYGSRQQLNSANQNGKLIVAGFSQGCGMSLFSFYTEKDKINAVIGLSGYLFPFTPFEPTDRFHRIIYGTDDQLRPWEYVKTTYQGKIGGDKITMVQNTGHEINEAVCKQFLAKIKESLQI